MSQFQGVTGASCVLGVVATPAMSAHAPLPRPLCSTKQAKALLKDLEWKVDAAVNKWFTEGMTPDSKGGCVPQPSATGAPLQNAHRPLPPAAAWTPPR